MTLQIITNNHPRDIVDGSELTPAEREEFDYIDWPAVERGEESASFFRYRGETYDLAEFTVDYGITRGSGLPDHLAGWDAYRSDSFYSALAIRLVDGCERVVVARVLS